jgi:hypothetical protein
MSSLVGESEQYRQTARKRLHKFPVVAKGGNGVVQDRMTFSRLVHDVHPRDATWRAFRQYCFGHARIAYASRRAYLLHELSESFHVAKKRARQALPRSEPSLGGEGTESNWGRVHPVPQARHAFPDSFKILNPKYRWSSQCIPQNRTIVYFMTVNGVLTPMPKESEYTQGAARRERTPGKLQWLV